MSHFSLVRGVGVAAAVFCMLASAAPSPQGSAVPSGSLLDSLHFRSIGPATMGGRIDDLAVLERRPSVYYAGVATGGVWKTDNNGTTWKPVFDSEDYASIGAVAIAQGSADLVWVGTGENNNRQSTSWGGGVYKSTDAGRTWRHMGLGESRHTGRIVIDPVDHDVVYVAAMGHLWGPNRERGVYKTVDGGWTWTQVLFVDEHTGATDLVMDPLNNKVLYAAMYQRQRAPWGFNGGGPGSGIYKSADAGRTWSRLTEGLPPGPLGRIGLDIYRSDPNVLYALLQHETESGIYRSGDAGAHWTRMSNVNPRPMYFSKVRVDPNNESRIYVLGVRLMISDDSGRSFSEVHIAHTAPGGERPRDDLDVHAMWVDPHDSSHLIIGTDVGIATSYDRGATWDYLNNLPIGQFYHVGYDMDRPYRVYGGMQDNDVWGGPNSVRNRFGIDNGQWYTLSIGDGFAAMADPRDARTVYAETQNGNIARVDRDTNEKKTIRPQAARGEPPLRWAWDTPLLLSPHDSNTLLTGANKVFRSNDRGHSWVAISPDLTSGVDRETLLLMGVAGKDIKISKNDGISAYPAIVALTESPKRAGVYYAGSDDGTIHVSKDGGKSWTNISGRFPGLPPKASAGRLVASAFDEGTAYATFNNHAADDYTPYVYRTTDYGNTWAPLAGTLPPGQVVNCLTEDPKKANVLYLGTESGLFLTLDGGRNWIRFKGGLPTVPVDEITIQPRENDLLLATHGRSIWILDDITPIQEAAEATQQPSFLFDIRPAVQFNPSNDYAGYPGDRRFWGRNPDFGAIITYYLAAAPKEIRLVIRDASGATVRELSSDDLKGARGAGLNRICWDLRHQPLNAPRTGMGPAGGGLAGPFVLPGQYQVALMVEGREAGNRAIRVEGDPLIQISDADRKAMHDSALALHELQRSIDEAAAGIGTASEQVRAVQTLMKSAAEPAPAAREAADALADRLARLARRIGAGRPQFGGGGEGSDEAPPVRPRVASLKNQIMASTSIPTAEQTRQAEESREDFAKLAADLKEVLTTALPGLYKTLNDSRISPAPAQANPRRRPAAPPRQ